MGQNLEQNNIEIELLVLGFLRTTLLPVLIVSLFAVALLAVSARIWLPGDMIAPAPLS